MIEEALVDAYGESEQVTAFYTMIEENMRFPFESVILGAKVQIEKVDLTDDERIVFVCRRGRERLLLDVRVQHPRVLVAAGQSPSESVASTR